MRFYGYVKGTGDRACGAEFRGLARVDKDSLWGRRGGLGVGFYLEGVLGEGIAVRQELGRRGVNTSSNEYILLGFEGASCE